MKCLKREVKLRQLKIELKRLSLENFKLRQERNEFEALADANRNDYEKLKREKDGTNR